VLCFGVKKLSDEDYESFKNKYDAIRAKKTKTREDDLEKLYDRMEQGLKYIGVTAIEDKL
jgi:magnesium-transporting ATPase (P-type)